MIIQTVISVVIGGALGFTYYKLVGCSSGGCPLTSNPYLSTLYGALFGFLAGTSFGR